MARNKRPILVIPTDILSRPRNPSRPSTRRSLDILPIEILTHIILCTDPLSRINLALCNTTLAILITQWNLLHYAPLHSSTFEEDLFISAFPFAMQHAQYTPNPALIGQRDRPTRRRGPGTIGRNVLRPTLLGDSGPCLHCQLCGHTFLNFYEYGPREPERTMLRHFVVDHINPVSDTSADADTDADAGAVANTASASASVSAPQSPSQSTSAADPISDSPSPSAPVSDSRPSSRNTVLVTKYMLPIMQIVAFRLNQRYERRMEKERKDKILACLTLKYRGKP